MVIEEQVKIANNMFYWYSRAYMACTNYRRGEKLYRELTRWYIIYSTLNTIYVEKLDEEIAILKSAAPCPSADPCVSVPFEEVPDAAV